MKLSAAETKALISARTRLAMKRPDIAIKVKEIPRVRKHSEETKASFHSLTDLGRGGGGGG